jgi:hypothetical protein
MAQSDDPPTSEEFSCCESKTVFKMISSFGSKFGSKWYKNTWQDAKGGKGNWGKA